ncbi:MAG: hypothetical protein ACI8TA_003396 [Cyclobacteriaceae bacterium]|jgi:hypothetical protein
MNWKEIKVSEDSRHFTHQGEILFNTSFLDVLKFHEPGLAPVKDEKGAFHIDVKGNPLYAERYSRTFGYYCNRASVVNKGQWFHLDQYGIRVYNQSYQWTGNYQDDICTVRENDKYYHIDLSGTRIYKDNHKYAGDFKDGIACVKTTSGFFRHVRNTGEYLNESAFLDLGVFHKGFATARDEGGWHHIDFSGKELYKKRYSSIEPFYNGNALVTDFDMSKHVIDERGKIVTVI